jgi:hypothetical protein
LNIQPDQGPSVVGANGVISSELEETLISCISVIGGEERMTDIAVVVKILVVKGTNRVACAQVEVPGESHDAT